MFTGIVEELGAIASIEGDRVRVAAATVTEDARVGDSIAVDGCCLTVVATGDGWWEADVSDETRKRTTLGDRSPGDPVNLERPVRAQDRLGGHIVQGYVDGKGSVTVDGVSLTVVDVLDDGFTVAVIPHTAAVTTLGRKGPGDQVNLEVDVTVKDAVAAIGRGEIVVVVDDEDRENEGDLIMAAEFATPEAIAFFLHHTSGVICAPVTRERASELDLPLMVANNTESMRTAFTVSVDYRHGTSAGSSAHDRSATIQALVAPSTRAADLLRPGHIFPLE